MLLRLPLRLPLRVVSKIPYSYYVEREKREAPLDIPNRVIVARSERRRRARGGDGGGTTKREFLGRVPRFKCFVFAGKLRRGCVFLRGMGTLAVEEEEEGKEEGEVWESEV